MAVCYSPHPPEVYTQNGSGPGAWYASDLQKWNLVWLSAPSLDLYLDAHRHLSSEALETAVSPHYLGAVAACLRQDWEEFWPELRHLLSRPQAAFLAAFEAGPWQDLPPYQLYGDEWIETVRARASNPANTSVAKVLAERAEARIYHFADYRRKA